MSLIKCPECGGAVSSTAQNCVHCGFTFRVCAECGTVYSAKAKACPQCGCCAQPQQAPQAVAAPPSESETRKKPSPGTVKLEERMEKDYPVYRKKKKTVSTLGVICGLFFGVLAILFFACGMCSIFDPLAALMLMGLLTWLGPLLLVVFVILVLVAIVFYRSAQKVLWEGYEWFSKQKIDAHEYFALNFINPKEYLQDVNSPYYIVSRWAFFAEHPDKVPLKKQAEMADFVVWIILIPALLVISFLLGWELLSIAVDGALDTSVFTSSPFIALYIWFGVVFIYCIIASVMFNPAEKAFQEWLEKFMRQTEPRQQNIKG